MTLIDALIDPSLAPNWPYCCCGLSHRVVPIAKRFEWTPGSRHSEEADWPPLGLGLEVSFTPPAPVQPAVSPLRNPPLLVSSRFFF